jgi:hypothetical protein
MVRQRPSGTLAMRRRPRGADLSIRTQLIWESKTRLRVGTEKLNKINWIVLPRVFRQNLE